MVDINHKRAIFAALLLVPLAVVSAVVGCAKEPKEDTASAVEFDGSVPESATKTKSASDAAKEDAKAKSSGSKKSDDPVVERGRYLVDNVAGCGDCHTPGGATPDPSQYLAGVDCLVPLENGNGCLHSANLTPSNSGLGRRTDSQIKAMFMDGRRPEGNSLNPVMPYWVFHNMTEEDADAIVKYLRWIDPVEHIVAPDAIAFMTRKPAAPIDKNTIPKAKGSVDGGPNAENGRYLATMAGRCLECHTPDSAQGAIRPIDMKYPFSGNRSYSARQYGLQVPPAPEVIYSTNITPAYVAGIGEYSNADIQRAIRDGLDHNGGKMCPPMPSGIGRTYSGLTDQDVLDIATYIQNVPGSDKFTTGSCLIQLE